MNYNELLLEIDRIRDERNSLEEQYYAVQDVSKKREIEIKYEAVCDDLKKLLYRSQMQKRRQLRLMNLKLQGVM